MRDGLGLPGNGVSWKDLHAELMRRDEAQRQRDERQQGLMEEVRDSLGAMHTRLIDLPCAAHEAATKALSVEIADARAGMLDVRPLKKLVIVPTRNPKVLIFAMTVAGGMLGWDWWPRLTALIEQATK